jgi:hypothetical protein
MRFPNALCKTEENHNNLLSLQQNYGPDLKLQPHEREDGVRHYMTEASDIEHLRLLSGLEHNIMLSSYCKPFHC